MNESKWSRRDVIRSATTGMAVGAVAGGAMRQALAQAATPGVVASTETINREGVKNGKLNQSVCQWCFGGMPIEKLAEESSRIGLKGIDLIYPDAFPILKKHGLVSTMTQTNADGFGIGNGFNRKENHEGYIKVLRRSIEATAAEGFPNVICFSGNRGGMSDAEGLKNCAEGLKQIVGFAEEKKVTICMELLNSKRDHGDYMCDRTKWGADLVQAVGSPRFKLLYDIYHMQVQEGDVIATFREFKDSIGHYHTAGVPGRHEIDLASQELSYPAIARAIADLGFTGYFAHEFLPKKDPMTSLAEAARLCVV